jgi:hypothetical protein
MAVRRLLHRHHKATIIWISRHFCAASRTDRLLQLVTKLNPGPLGRDFSLPGA